MQIGQHLKAICDEGLYTDTHPTFEAYCRERWGWSAHRAYQLIHGASVVENLSEMSTVVDIPAERQVRPLARLEPEQQRELWREAQETAPNGRITQQHMRQIVSRGVSGRRDSRDPALGQALAPVYNQSYRKIHRSINCGS